jgi:hypothetical protein
LAILKVYIGTVEILLLFKKTMRVGHRLTEKSSELKELGGW